MWFGGMKGGAMALTFCAPSSAWQAWLCSCEAQEEIKQMKAVQGKLRLTCLRAHSEQHQRIRQSSDSEPAILYFLRIAARNGKRQIKWMGQIIGRSMGTVTARTKGTPIRALISNVLGATQPCISGPKKKQQQAQKL
jgi:hypothetical protein